MKPEPVLSGWPLKSLSCTTIALLAFVGGIDMPRAHATPAISTPGSYFSRLVIQPESSDCFVVVEQYQPGEAPPSVADPALPALPYEDDRLVAVTWPDGGMRQYPYEDTRFPDRLTGMIDERGVRTFTAGYDYRSRAVQTVGPDGADHCTTTTSETMKQAPEGMCRVIRLGWMAVLIPLRTYRHSHS